jgi:peptidoglycan hydrolase CwlO-like protein
MSITIESDLKEILTRLEQKIDSVQKDVGELKISMTEFKGDLKKVEIEIRGEIKTLESSLRGEIKTLDEKVTGFGKRLENQEFVNRGILVSLVIAILGGFAKLFGFIGNP